MSCNFKMELPGVADSHIETAKAAIIKHGGTFQLKGKGGTFEINTALGKIAGSFVLNGSEATFQIDKKPFIITCSRIEKELHKYVGAK